MGILPVSKRRLGSIPVRLLVAGLAALLSPQWMAAAEESLTVERLASLPSLIGTAPSNPVWAPDSTRLAFLWNDKAMPFRDVWVVSATEGEPRRITEMGHSSSGDAADLDIQGPEVDPVVALKAKAAERARRGVSELVWSPNGDALIFTYRGDLFRVNADGTRLKQLTRTGGDKHALAFSPNGRFLSFLQDGDLWLWNQESNDLVRATRIGVPPVGRVPARHFRLDTEFSSYKWSSDSRRVALQFEDRSKVRKLLFPNYLTEETSFDWLRRDYPGDNDFARAVGIYSVADGRLDMLETEEKTDRRINSYAWSPDGSRLLIDQSSEDAVHRWIYVASAEDRSIENIWHDSRKTRLDAMSTSQWQRDGSGVLFVSDKDGFNHLYALPLDRRAPTQLTAGDWSIVAGFSGTGPVISTSTGELYFISTKKNPYERQVYRMPEKGGSVEQVTSLPGGHLPFMAPDGSKIALLHSNDVTPTELYIVDVRSGTPERRITHSQPKDFFDYQWLQPRYVTFKSHVDGTTLHGRLLVPANLDRSKKYPVIIGPVYSNTVRNGWRGIYNTLQQYLALEGQYIGLHVDIRGSSGYGASFRDGFKMAVGDIDIEDLHSGVKYLETLPYVDPERIGIWGSSYGGLLTTMSLFKKPGVYKAGVAGAPATSVWHAMTSEVRLLGRPYTDPEMFRKGSAYRYGEDLQDHLMIIHGMQDSTVLFRDSAALAEKLMLLGKDFDFVIAPSANHGWTQKDYVAVYLLRKLVGHFDRHLGRGPR